MKDYLNHLSKEVIGAAIEVHRDLGPGLLEMTYELSLQHELQLRGFASVRQVVLPIQYKGLVVPEAYRIDLLVGTAWCSNSKRLNHFFPFIRRNSSPT